MSLLDFGEDSPSSPPSNNAAPAQASGGNNDPFGNDPFGSNDPFGTDGSSAQDPFGGGEGVKASDDPFGASSGGDAFDPFSSPPPSSMDQKSPSSNPGAFDDFDPFSGPLLSPSAAPAQENKPAKDAFSFSDNDDLFGGGGGSDSTAVKSEVAASGESDFDPFGTDLLGGSEKTKEEEETPNKDEVEIPNEDEESKMSANGDKTSSLEAQFDDLMGDMNGSGEVTTMEVTRTETSSEVSSSQGPATLAPVAAEETLSASLLVTSQTEEEEEGPASPTNTPEDTRPTSPNPINVDEVTTNLETLASSITTTTTTTNRADEEEGGKPDGASQTSSQGEREGSPGLSDAASLDDSHDGPQTTRAIEEARAYQRGEAVVSRTSSSSSSRFEDTIADFQPPRRYVKEEKKAPPTAATTFIMGSASETVCKVCQKRVYEMEKVIADNKIYHKTCFKCEQCKRTLSLGNFAGMDGKMYCKPHFISLFKTKGNYDEGFGKERHTKQWQQPGAGSTVTTTTTTTYSTEAGAHGQPDEEREIVRSDEVEEAPENLPSIRNIRAAFENTPANTSYSRQENGSREELADVPPQVHAVRTRYQVSTSESDQEVRNPRSASKWDKPAVPPPPPINHRSDDEDEELDEDDLPPVAVTSSLVSRFRELESGSGDDSSVGYRKPVRKMTPPRDELEAEVRQFQQQEVQRNPDIVRAEDPSDREEELPPPQYTRSLVSKFREIESSAPKSPVLKKEVREVRSVSNNRSPDSGINEPAQRNGGGGGLNGTYNGGDEATAAAHAVRETDQNTEEELPERGFTKSLLAQWQNKLQDDAISSTLSSSSQQLDNTSPGHTNGGVNYNRSWSYKQREAAAAADVITATSSSVSYSSPPPQQQQQQQGDQYDTVESNGGVSENHPDRLDGVVRESDHNEEDYLPPASFTKNMLAKFQSMEAQQQSEVTVPLPKQKQFKWQVKEPQTLRGPYKSRSSSSANGSSAGTENDYEAPAHGDSEPNSQDYELPQQAYTKSVLAKFRDLEDSNQAPPSPQRSNSNVKRTTAVHVEQRREQPDGDEYDDDQREERKEEQEEEELPEEGTTRNLLAKFQAMQA